MERVYREVVLLENTDSAFLPKIIEHHLSVEDKKYYIVEEYIKGQDLLKSKTFFDSEDKIKALITDPELTINNKGMNQYDIQSHHRFARLEILLLID